MGMSLLFLISNSGQINHQIKVLRSCCTFSLSQGEKEQLVLELDLQKNDFHHKGSGRGKADASVSSGKREGLEATELQCLASQRSQQFRMAGASLPRRMGEITGKEGQDPDTHMALPGTEQGTCLRPNCCPLGAYSYNNTRWESTTMYRM